MAGDDSAQEKTQDPTPKKLADARRKGQIARSRELNTSVMLLASAAAMYLWGGTTGVEVLTLIESQLQLDRKAIFDVTSIVTELTSAGTGALKLLLPLFLLMCCAAVAAPTIVGGVGFSREAFSPKFSRMNPLAGLKRMFGLQGLMELIKSVLKVVLLAGVSVWLFLLFNERFLVLGMMSNGQGVNTALSMILLIFTALSATTLVIAAIDVPYVKWDHIRKLRMTHQEIKDEAKESDGSPEVRSKRRAMQQEVANRKMLQEVKNSDVVITNPTHFSVALKYDLEGDKAPVVVAKGVDHLAFAIREIADRNNIPRFENVLLARTLYHNVKVDQEIPVDLYNAIAQVLAYVFQLRDYKKGTAAEPDYPKQLPIPDMTGGEA